MREVHTCPICHSTTFQTVRSCKDYTASYETFTLKECTSCHFIVTSPSPEISQLYRYYKSDQYISHTSNANSLIDAIYLLVRSYTLKSKLKLVNRYSGQNQNKTILDYGCGTGQFLKICNSSGWNVTGIEPSPDARNLAQVNCPHSIVSSIEEIPIEKQFQVITLWHVLEHIPDLNQTLSTLRQRLKDNGRLIVAIPNHNSHDAVHYKDHWAGYDVPRHLWHFSQKNIETLLQNHGFTIERKAPMPFDAYYVSLLSEKYLHHNRLTLSGITRALLNGFQSNRHAKADHEYSSIIYIAEK